MKFMTLIPRSPLMLDDHLWLGISPVEDLLLAHLPLKRKCSPSPQPRKYRIVCDCPGYSRDSIKVEVLAESRCLVVSGHERKQHGTCAEDNEYTLSEFRRKFPLPENADAEKLVSFLTPSGQFVVELPLKQQEPDADDDAENEDESFVRLVDSKEDGGKEARLHVTLPSDNIDPAKVNVSVKDRDVLVHFEDERVSFFKRHKMPPGTLMEQLKCAFDTKRGNRLLLTAPVKQMPSQNDNGWKSVAIEHKEKKQPEEKEPTATLNAE